jgi:hypothetical protein
MNDPVLFQPSVAENHNLDFFTSGKCPNAVVIDLLYMPELVLGKVILHTYKKCNLLPDTGNFKVLGFCGCILAANFWDVCMILTMLIQAGNLAPVYVPLLIRFPVKHMRVNATDGKPPVIYPAPVVLKEVAGPAVIVLCPECIPGYIECSFLVAKLRERSRFNRFRINFPGYCHITVEKEYMAVECPGAAPAAEITPEPDLPNNRCKPFLRVCKEFG